MASAFRRVCCVMVIPTARTDRMSKIVAEVVGNEYAKFLRIKFYFSST